MVMRWEIAMLKKFYCSVGTENKVHSIVMASAIACFASWAQATEIRHGDGEVLKPSEQPVHSRPDGRGFGEPDHSGATERQAKTFSSSSTNGIFYHGGPVLHGTVNVYYIWYGAWNFSSDNTNIILNDFANAIGAAPNGTPYFNINKTYTDSNGAVSGIVATTTGSSIMDAGSQGTALTDATVANVVANALSSKALPTDPNGVYFVMASKEVNETSGLCTQYCAWHNSGTIGKTNIKYGFIGNPARCPTACSAQTVTPNANLAADGMANLVAHELAESVTDPSLNAWFDRRGFENADKCAWKFGATTTLSSGAKTNVSFGTRNWLLQQNWLNANGGLCTLAN
jgi:hypothetical protein